jgi:hypothetical protein
MNVKDLKKEIKKALQAKRLLENNSPVAGKKDEIDRTILNVVRKFSTDEVKRTLVQEAGKKDGVKFKFYRGAILAEVGSGKAEVATFFDKGFTLKGVGIWELSAEISDNRWNRQTAHKFTIAVGLPANGDLSISEIPSQVIEFVSKRRKEEEVKRANAKALDKYLADSGFITEDETAVVSAVKLKGMLD